MWDSSHLGSLLDNLNQSLITLSCTSNRRVSIMLSSKLNNGLMDNLATEKNNSSIGLVQAQALQSSLITKLRLGAYPAYVLSMPLNNQDDFAYMGNNSLLQLLNNLEIIEEILAIELLIVSEFIYLRKKKLPRKEFAKKTTRFLNFVSSEISLKTHDRYYKSDIQAIRERLKSKEIDNFL